MLCFFPTTMMTRAEVGGGMLPGNFKILLMSRPSSLQLETTWTNVLVFCRWIGCFLFGAHPLPPDSFYLHYYLGLFGQGYTLDN